MESKIDIILGRILKNWVARHEPPVYGRARLLLLAAYTPRKKRSFSALIPRNEFNDYPMHGGNANEWSPAVFTWFFEQSFHSCIQARV